MFWYYLVGWFIKIPAPQAYQYAAAHRSTFGKYFAQLPVSLLPWTALAAAAVCRAWDRSRLAAAPATHGRFAVCASLPWLVLLSLAATARDIYAAPALLGFSLLIALWVSESQRLAATPRAALRWTGWAVGLVATTFASVVIALAPIGRRTPIVAICDLALAAAVLAGTAFTLRRGAQAQRRREILCSFEWTHAPMRRPSV